MKRKFNDYLWLLVVVLISTSCSPQAQTPPAPTSTATPAAEEPAGNIFFAEPAQIAAGECAFLRWEVKAEYGVNLDDRPVANAGELEVCPQTTTQYVLWMDTGIEIEDLRVEIVVITPAAEQPPGPVQAGVPAYLSQEWVSTGGPPGGLGYDIRMDPRNPDVMYVTDAQTGVFKSLDGGENWFAINQGITTRTGYSGTAIPVFSLTIDPNHPDTLWAGTQFSSGVFRSDDGGQNWQEMNRGNNGIQEEFLSIRGFTVQQGNSDVVYFAAEVSSWEWFGAPLNGIAVDKTKGVLYKTTDGGLNWKRIWYGDNLARYVWIDPTDPNRVYASTGIFDREAANSDAGSHNPGGVGILRSKDGGNSWQVLNEANGIHPFELYFGSLFMDPLNPKILIGAAGNDPYMSMAQGFSGAIYLTEDGGDHWQRVLGLPNASTVEICTSDTSVVYAGSINGIYRSNDGGHSWQQTAGRLWGSADVVAGFPIDMQCDPRDPMRIFVNNYIGGNFLSEDGGVNWRVVSKGYTGAMQRQVGVTGDAQIVYTAGRMGVFKSDDYGETWQGTAYGAARVPEAIVVAVSPFNAEYVMTVIQDGGPDPKLSEDGGMNWTNIQSGLWKPGEFPAESITRILFSPSDPKIVFASAGSPLCFRARDACEMNQGLGIIRSMDGGKTWEKTALDEGQVMDFKVLSDGMLYAAVYPAAIYQSTDNGDHWELMAQDISASIPGTFIDVNFARPYILSIAVDPFNPNTLYAGFERGGVMVSRDSGQTWQHYSAGMPPETTITDIEMDVSHPGILYVSSLNSGVYYLTAETDQWTALNDGLSIRTAVDLSLTADGSLLFLATDGGGVYRLGGY